MLFHAYRHRPTLEFWNLLSSRTLARNLFIKYCSAKVGSSRAGRCVCVI